MLFESGCVMLPCIWADGKAEAENDCIILHLRMTGCLLPAPEETFSIVIRISLPASQILL